MSKVFISYRRSDSQDVTGRIYDWLVARFGRDNVFLDLDSIPVGVDFREHLDKAVGRCDVLLAVIGDSWLGVGHGGEANQRWLDDPCDEAIIPWSEVHFGRDKVFVDPDSIPPWVDFRERDVLPPVIGDSWLDVGHGGGANQRRRLDDPRDFVRIEIESALARGIPVVPVLVGRASMPSVEDLPESLKRLAYQNAAEVRSGLDFSAHVARLIRGIERLLAARKATVDVPVASTPAVARPVTSAPPQPQTKPALPESFTNSIGMKFVLVKPGAFLMGSPADEAERSIDETQHEVTITKAFWLGVYPVTQGQWKKVMGSNPSWYSRGGTEKDRIQEVSEADLDWFPVERVSWQDAQDFLNRLTALNEEVSHSRKYRLPTEAEWEYACRGGHLIEEIGERHTLPFHFNGPVES